MLVTVYQWQWLGGAASHEETIRTDPTRMAQGIMTGIGFLGYRMLIGTVDEDNLAKLAATLRKTKDILEFRISPTGD
jgi:hypothetical protein